MTFLTTNPGDLRYLEAISQLLAHSEGFQDNFLNVNGDRLLVNCLTRTLRKW